MDAPDLDAAGVEGTNEHRLERNADLCVLRRRKERSLEEGSLAGGFGSAVMERVQDLGIEDVEFHRIGIPDEYVHHGTQDILRAQYDLHPEGIAARVRKFLHAESQTAPQAPRLASTR